MLSHFSRVRLYATLWTTAHQAPLSTGFSRQEYWSGLPFPSPPRKGRGWEFRVRTLPGSEPEAIWPLGAAGEWGVA